MIRRLILALLVSAASLHAQTTAAPATDPWKPLQFLIGSWEAKTGGGTAEAQSAGVYLFQPELKGHVLARHGKADTCKAPDAFDCDHDDLLYIYVDFPGQPYKAIYFDNEGHVLHYDVTTPTAASVVFLTDPSTPGPQFRLSYELKDGTMYGKFQSKMPGSADFKSYLEWSGKKQ